MTTVFTLKKGEGQMVVLVYIDNLLINDHNMQMIDESKRALHQQFKFKDLGELKYFFGIKILRSYKSGLLNQRKYILELISNMGLTGAKPTPAPLKANLRLTSVEVDQTDNYKQDAVLSYITSYQKIVGKLMYATITRHGICYAV